MKDICNTLILFLNDTYDDLKVVGPYDYQIKYGMGGPQGIEPTSKIESYFLINESNLTISEIKLYEKTIYFEPNFYLSLMEYFSIGFEQVEICVLAWFDSTFNLGIVNHCGVLPKNDLVNLRFW